MNPMVGHHLGQRNRRPKAENRRPSELVPRGTRPKIGSKERPTAGYWMVDSSRDGSPKIGSKERPRDDCWTVDSSKGGWRRTVPRG
ncbi:MAG: hypothetical protein EA381_17460 [Planctomycetaceae bacterium]|nr:MAG: hypothetical protein EA381_17460 [Planctomycetaceae bacterium]